MFTDVYGHSTGGKDGPRPIQQRLIRPLCCGFVFSRCRQLLCK